MSDFERIIANVLMGILKELWTNLGTGDLSQDVKFGDLYKYKITLSNNADFVLYKIVEPENYIEMMTVNDATGKYSEAVDLISRCIELDVSRLDN